ncbi:sensor histidine kinase [Spiribacter sp. 221]|uniref:sensor histidine kinase n=1 Tax=Spiribacter onubensis TaxID=3122420 RepID=UPI00349F59B8
MRGPIRSGLWIGLLLGIMACLPAGAVVVTGGDAVNLNSHVEYLEDPGGRLTLEEVRSGRHAGRFRPHDDGAALNFGLSDCVWWLRLELESLAPEATDYLLEVGYFGLVDVRFYPPDGPELRTGYNEAVDDRPLPHRHFLFPVTLRADTVQSYYLRVASNGSVTVPLTLWKPEAFVIADRLQLAGLMIYFGVLLGLLLYNLFLFFSLRERQYALYCAFLLFVGVAMTVHNGFRTYLLLLWPGWPDTLGTNSLFALAGIFGILFVREFLSTRSEQPRLDGLLLSLAGVFLVIALLPVLQVPVRFGSVAISVAGSLTGPLLLLISFRSWRRGHPGARYLLVAWALLLIAVFIQALRNFALIPTTFITGNLLQIGSLLEMLLLSFALADRIQTERRGRETAQMEALQAERQLVEGLRASEQRLEGMVEQRTRDLEEALERERTMLDQYVEFAGLISHEFRNPLAVIAGQAQVARMERDRGVGEPLKRFEAIEEAAGRLQLLFEQWLESDRLTQGNSALEPVRLDLAEWLPRLFRPGNLRIGHPLQMADLAGVIVADEALVGNAVHNLIDNAAKYSAEGEPIEIGVLHAAGEIGIRVCDHGIGMSAEEQAQAFERHYRAPNNRSTRGMGIGLYLVSQVMSVHGGRVALESEPGQGSCFTLWFPRARG